MNGTCCTHRRLLLLLLLRLLLLALILSPTQAVFLVRPFLKSPFWNHRPTTLRTTTTTTTTTTTEDNKGDFLQKPVHNFWPYIPVKEPPGHTRWPKGEAPRHHFWPFVPLGSPDHRRGGWQPGSADNPPGRLPPLLPTKPPQKYNYAEAMYKSMLFYEAQRSGRLPTKRKVKWRGHSALGDRGLHGEDLTGGWYDAGDYVKFGFPMAGASTMLLLGLIEFQEAYRGSGLLQDMLQCVRWPLDYFLKAHTARYEFYAEVGDPYMDHSYWGRPEDLSMDRPAYRLTPQTPGTDLLAETAAALAAGSIAFKGPDPNYSKLLLRHAIELYDFADRYRGLYSDSLPIVQDFYSSSGYSDELSWAAAWLFRATGERRYLQKAEDNYVSSECWAVSWDNKECLAAALLYMLTKKDIYRRDIEQTMKAWMPGGSVDYTPAGLAFRSPWGPLRYAANMAVLALVSAQAGIEPETYRRWARGQIHYILGDSGRSFVIGFGQNPPSRPHHPASSCPPPPGQCTWSNYYTSSPNPVTLYGAVVGGPAVDDTFQDDRQDFYQSEVTCDYNAGFQTALAGLMQLDYQKQG